LFNSTEKRTANLLEKILDCFFMQCLVKSHHLNGYGTPYWRKNKQSVVLFIIVIEFFLMYLNSVYVQVITTSPRMGKIYLHPLKKLSYLTF